MLIPLIKFLFIHPLLCLFIIISFYGWGKLINYKQKEPLINFSNGLYLSIVFIFISGLLGIINQYTCFIYLISGFITSAFFFLKKQTGTINISLKPNFYWILIPYFALIYIRCSTPPYFIDFLQYHLPYCYEIINHQGFKALPHFFLASTASTFVGESLFIFPLILSEPSSAVLFNGLLSICILFYLKKILKVYLAESSTNIIIVLVLSCEIFFHNTIYGKTENTIILIILDLILRLTQEPFKNKFNKFSIGFTLSLFLFFKISMGIVFLFLSVWTFWIAKKSKQLNFTCLFLMVLGGSIPLTLFLLKNIATHGMPFYPLFYNPNLLPTLFENGPSSTFQAKNFDIQRIIISTIDLFKGHFSYGFSPGYLSWFLSLGIILAILKKNYSYLVLLFFVILHWQYWVVNFIFPNSAFRLSFPAWIIPIIALGFLISKYKSKKLNFIILFFAIICYLQLLASHSKFLPGLRYHLGQQSLSEYYINMSTPIGSINKDVFSNLLDGKYIAISSEFAGAFYHPKVTYVNCSNVFDKKKFKNSEDFLKTLTQENIQYVISDKSLDSGLSKWSEKAANESGLKIVSQKYDITIYENNL